MTLMRVDPWNMLTQLQNEMNRLFESRLGLDEGANGRVVTADWIPAVDIKEEDQRYVIHADVPGVDPKDIEVTMENGILTIRGKRELEREEEREGFKRVERARGTFYRRFSLPDTADAEKIAASMKNGVLEVVIPKKEQVQPRRITVQA
ncbi:Hsp20/alpha crystallin family protein [Inmirania thermothiophila]|uniref:HSP20 family protein n=1 Tax=Inmirania thermothiophila TaxID=1750597 RepID=A0A3N1Y6X3_9GAMM|nr:Hsp20/alpha crystallin family protein [Inmirania thermothiophila]ROR34566.1 HSP20 family protein [Inmirania thermothiophila]